MYTHVNTYIYIYDGCPLRFERDHLLYLSHVLSPLLLLHPLNCMDQSFHFMCHWKTITHSESELRAVQAQLTINKLTRGYLLDLFLCYIYIYVTGKLTKIPKMGLYFRTCEDGAGWHLIPYRNKSCSEFFSQADKNWHITWGNDLGPDWPPLAKGSKISHYHTPTRPLNFFPLDNRRIRAYRS